MIDSETYRLGLLAGLATSVLWVFTSLFFSSAGRRVGSTTVNAVRLVVAVLLHMVTFRLIEGVWWPAMADAQLWLLIGSGFVGLTLCDQLLFTAFVDLGPRKALLMMTTSPLWAVAMGWVFLGDRLGPGGWLGVLLTVAGVAIVVLERPTVKLDEIPHPHQRRGWWFAAIAAACQAGGMLLSQRGMKFDGDGAVPLDPQTATMVRMVAGLAGILPWLVFRGFSRSSAKSVEARSRRSGSKGVGYALIVAGAVVGPFLGVWLSLISLNNAPLGIAQTVCSLSPVFILPISTLVMKEHVNLRGWIGAALAVAGTAVLFLID